MAARSWKALLPVGLPAAVLSLLLIRQCSAQGFVGSPPPPAPPLVVLSADASSGCPASGVLLGGCAIPITNSGGVNMEVHYLLRGPLLDIALTGNTEGYLSISFGGNSKMFPADSVIAWVSDTSGPSINGYGISSYDIYPSNTKDPGLPVLTSSSVTKANGVVTVKFTRKLADGNFPIDPTKVYFNVAWSKMAALVQHDAYTALTANFLTGGGATIEKDPRDKFWVSHGVLAIVAWAFLAPHAVLFAVFKAKWGVIFGSAAMWFHLHRLFQFGALALHIATVVLPGAKFGNYVSDNTLKAHAALAWIMTALLGIQWVTAIWLRPDKTHPRRAQWNLGHFTSGRLMMLMGLANIAIGIYLYHRKQAFGKLMSDNAWIGLYVGVVASVVVHFLILAVMPAPPPKPAPMDDVKVPDDSDAKVDRPSGALEHSVSQTDIDESTTGKDVFVPMNGKRA